MALGSDIKRDLLPVAVAVLGALALAANAVLVLINVRRMVAAEAWIAHTHQVLEAEEAVLWALQDAEAGQRGYLLTGRSEYLNPWEAADASAEQLLDTLERLTADHAEQAERVRQLRPVVEARLAELRRTIVLAREGGLEAAREVVLGGEGRRLMEEARLRVGELTASEQRLMDERGEASRAASQRTVVAHVATLTLSLALLATALVFEGARRRARARARQQEHRYQLVAAHSRDIVLFMRRDGRILEANAAASQAYGYTVEALRSLSIHDLRAPGTRSLTEDQMAQADAAGLLFETVHRRSDGSTFPVEVSSQGADVDGERTLVSLIRDITARKRAERELRASEARLRQLSESLPQLVWTAGADGQRDYFNQRWRDYTGQVTGAEEWDPALHPDDRERVLEIWREAVANQKEFEVEHRLRRHDGEYRWFLRRAVLMEGQEGTLRRWFGSCTDVHDLKMSQELLRQADRLKQDFLSMASHEFRTPLTAMRLQVELLQRRLRAAPPADERVGRHVDAIEAQIARVDELLRVLLDVTRMNDGKLALEVASVDLGHLAREAAERLRPMAESAGSPLRVAAAAEVLGRWDRARLDQAVTNLLSNAIKYGNAQPVDVEVEARGDLAVLAVRDRGIGIPPESHGLIFERFERGANAGDARGLGLGLWIAKKMVDAHGGRIIVESTPGAGSTFTVLLPTSAGARPPVPGSEGGTPRARPDAA